MIDKFLKASHWEIFFLTIVIPVFAQTILMGLVFVGDDSSLMMSISSIITFIFMAGFLGWFWSVAIGLQMKVPEDITMKVKKFKLFLIIPLTYLLLISIGMGSMFNGDIESGQVSNSSMIAGIFAIIIPLHLFSIFCIFYCLYFVAKTFKTVELQREVKFSDFAGDFFLFWFFPIGIWIIQPKINKMVEAE